MDMSRHTTNLLIILYLVARGLALPLPLSESTWVGRISEQPLVRRGFDAPRIGDQIIEAAVDGHRTSVQVDSAVTADSLSRITENQATATVIEDFERSGSEQFRAEDHLKGNNIKSEGPGPGARRETGVKTITHFETAQPLEKGKTPLLPLLRFKMPAEGLLKAFFGTVDPRVKMQLKITLFVVCLKLKKFQIYDGSVHLFYEWKALREHKPYDPAPMTLNTFFNPFAMGNSER